MSRKIIQYFLIISILLSISCAPGFSAREQESISDSKLDFPREGTEIDVPEEIEIPPPVILSPSPTFCSKLDLDGVTWPNDLSVSGRGHLGLALNITGSFEGRSGWANLSNNFDGMGFSIGLLQQNLGTGSLQPMLIDAVNRIAQGSNFEVESKYAQAIKSMVLQWNRDRGVKAENYRPDVFQSDDKNISPYDNDFKAQEGFSDSDGLSLSSETKGISTANKNSVSWARKTVYTDGDSIFKPEWNKNLTQMAQSKPYISLQLKYAMKLYSQAFQYFKAFKLSTLGHFILMFDFVVQNGGFKKSLFAEYSARLNKRPSMNANEKVLLILELRLKDVLPQWQNDVSLRKKTIIYSKGTVHGVKRDLKEEYCYTPETPILTQP